MHTSNCLLFTDSLNEMFFFFFFFFLFFFFFFFFFFDFPSHLSMPLFEVEINPYMLRGPRYLNPCPAELGYTLPLQTV